MLGEQCLHFVLSTDNHDLTDFLLYRSASGKSGKSVDNNKKSLVARREMSSGCFIY